MVKEVAGAPRGYRSVLVWLYCCFWVYPIFGLNWHRKWWYIGVGFFGTVKMEIGLLSYHVSINCGAAEEVQDTNMVARRVVGMCDAMHDLEGEFKLQELYDAVCYREEATFHMLRGCDVATVLYWSSVLMFVLLVGTILMLVACASLILYFETGEPSRRWKWWAQALYFTALGMQASLCFAYSVLNFNLDELYRFVDVTGFGKVIFNSPQNLMVTASYTAWSAMATCAVGLLFAFWTVLDLQTEEELYDEVMKVQRMGGLDDLEKEVLFGHLTPNYGALSYDQDTTAYIGEEQQGYAYAQGQGQGQYGAPPGYPQYGSPPGGSARY